MPALRPSFELPVAGAAHEVMDRLRRRLREDAACHGISVGDHAELFLPPGSRRAWSPWLSVTVETGKAGVVLRGRFSPHPAAWTLVMFLIFLGSFAAFVGLVWGLAQWSLDQTPWALLAVPVAVAAIAGVVAAARTGQRLAAGDMEALRAGLERLVGARAQDAARTDPSRPA